ncbi:chromosome transmission fidelity protein 18 homolog [Cloeon dipterum]|uniref:chromosome transmission fidelity protein 18 homolog n=1 Tax=Cloeon dipterum TaxID=197152 RepID=UPI0032202EA1
MDEYPDPDEEFELMYAQEMEVMREMEEHIQEDNDGESNPKRAKKSLSFTAKQSEPVNENEDAANLMNSSLTGTDDHSQNNSNKTTDAEAESRLQIIREEINQSSSRKRKAEDLFGDIEDIEQEEYYDYELGTKKEKDKTEQYEDDMKLIARIRKERQKALALGNILSGNGKREEPINDLGSNYISARIPQYPFVTMRNFNSEKFYLRLKSDEFFANEVSNISVKKTNLLPTSLNNIWQEAQTLLQKMKHVPSTQQEEEELLEMMDASTDTPLMSEKLWVEKYQPRSYRELLSDEGTNKTVLKWLKMWDSVVFNKKMPSRENKPAPKNPDWKFGGKRPFQALDEEFDSHGRPMQKIALLCGPPGLGKTTLAHILAKHAGYNTVEVNASDDSSADSFRLVLEASTQMKSVIGDSPRPNCLILDEIDGTPASTIDVLLKFIMDKDITKGKKKKGAKPRILRRPIICICNDPYVPALRQLKQQALIINFPPTAASRLAQRLMDVAKQEQLQTDLGTLLLLCDKTGNDIRSCLSFLHFFKTRNKVVRLTDVQSASVGQKDSQKGLFAVWHELFQIVKPKNSSDTSQRGRMHRILKIVQNYGEYEFLSQGVFENFLHMKTRETGLRSIVYGSSWFCQFDLFNAMIKQQQNYALMPYLPYCFTMWHLLYASLSWPKISFPSKHIEAKNKTSQTVSTLASLMKGMEPALRSGIKANELLCDTLPLMLHIIVPNLKAVNAQLLSADEKVELQRVVNIFAGYNMSFIQERTASGEMLYRLEPNVPEMVQFPDVQRAPEMIYAVKQLVGHEVDSEKLRRISLAAGTLVQVQVQNTPSREKKSQAKAVAAVPNHLQTLSPQILRKGPLKPGLKNWLNIAKSTPTPSQIAEEMRALPKNELKEISFVYKEGYSNAVRKPIKIADLF